MVAFAPDKTPRYFTPAIKQSKFDDKEACRGKFGAIHSAALLLAFSA
jgi:hypothetical protein